MEFSCNIQTRILVAIDPPGVMCESFVGLLYDTAQR